MRKVVRVYQEWISQEEKPPFMAEPEEDERYHDPQDPVLGHGPENHHEVTIRTSPSITLSLRLF